MLKTEIFSTSSTSSSVLAFCGWLCVVYCLHVGHLIMLSRNYNPQVIVPTESSYKANTFPKYNTQSAGVQWPTLMYGPSVKFGQAVIITHFYDWAPLCRWGHCTIKSLYSKRAWRQLKYNSQRHIGWHLNCQTYIILTVRKHQLPGY